MPSSFSFGDKAIPADNTIRGTIAVARGSIDMFGTVDGDVVAVDGDVRVHNGGRVTGDAWSIWGTVSIDGGVVEGERRAVAVPRYTGARLPSHAPLTVWQALKLALGWFAVLAIIGIGVMLFAEANLDGVVTALERGFARAFWLGVAGQLLALPGLLIVVVGLAITVLGLLLVPFAIVAYIVAGAGWSRWDSSPRRDSPAAASRPTRHDVAAWRSPPRSVHRPCRISGDLDRNRALLPHSGRRRGSARLRHRDHVGRGDGRPWRDDLVAGGNARDSAPASKFTGDELAWQTPTPVSGVAASSRRPVSSAP